MYPYPPEPSFGAPNRPQLGMTQQDLYGGMLVQKLPEHVDYVQVLWRRKWWVLAALFLGACVGAVRVIRQPSVFRATTSIELLNLNEGFMGDAAAPGANASNVQTQVRILMSARLVSKTAERVSLELAPITPPAPDIFGKVRNKLGLLAQEPVQLTKQGIQTAAVTLRARGIGATRLVEISCESISPEIATAFLAAHTSEYISQYSQLRSTNNSRTTQWLEGQLEEAKTRAEQADEKVREFVRASGMAPVENPSFDGRLQQLQADLTNAQSERIAKQAKLDLVKSGDGALIEDPGLRAMSDKLEQGRRRRAELLAIYTPEHAKVRQIEEQLGELERVFTREKDLLGRRLQSDYEVAMQRERSVRAAYNSQAGALSSQADKGSQYFMLKRESEVARQIYNTLLQQLNSASMASSAPNSNVRVIDPPVGDSRPFRPQPPRDITMSAGLFGAALAGFFASREYLRAKKMSLVVATPGHAPNLLSVPELGVIPSFETGVNGRWAFPAPKAFRRLQAPGDEHPGQELVMKQAASSVAAESIRFALTSLLSWNGPDSRKVFVVTSPGPGEGKTTIAANLALAVVEMGKRTLLIDADMRKPRLHTLFDRQDAPGLRDLLLCPEPIQDIELDLYIQETGIPGLSLMASGKGANESAATLLVSHRAAALLARLKEKFDVIMIDTAPAMHLADSRLLGRMSDGVILVMRSGVTPRESVMMIRQRLMMDQIPIAGTILNDWNAPDDSAYSYQGYKDYYLRKP